MGKCPKCGSHALLLQPREYHLSRHYKHGKRVKIRKVKCQKCGHIGRRSEFQTEIPEAMEAT